MNDFPFSVSLISVRGGDIPQSGTSVERTTEGKSPDVDHDRERRSPIAGRSLFGWVSLLDFTPREIVFERVARMRVVFQGGLVLPSDRLSLSSLLVCRDLDTGDFDERTGDFDERTGDVSPVCNPSKQRKHRHNREIINCSSQYILHGFWEAGQPKLCQTNIPKHLPVRLNFSMVGARFEAPADLRYAKILGRSGSITSSTKGESRSMV